jgi:hypothetical protein
VLAAAIGVGIVSGYVLALWWLLRGEQAWTYTALIALCSVALSLRVVVTTDYPAGVNEDEVKNLGCSIQALGWGSLFGESCNGPPYLLSTLFAAPLVPYIGATRWAMRSYSLVTGVLATPVAFAVARSMGLAVASSLTAAALVAVLPWSIFYGRITLGGELIFHQLLLLAGLARLVFADGGLADAMLGSFGLCLLLWDYLVGRSMMGMAVVAAVLARGWRPRLWSLAVIPLALLGWWAHLRTAPNAGLGFTTVGLNPLASLEAWHTFTARAQFALWTFVWPVAQNNLFTERAAAVHPVFLLVLAALGVLTGVRRGLFLLAGFAAGLMPGIVSDGGAISTHRIMMAFSFVVLAVASALDVLPWRRLRGAAATAIVLSAGVWSVAFYFSPRFWGQGGEHFNFDVERTELNELITENPPARLITMPQIGYYMPRPGPQTKIDMLTVDNWLPPNREAVTYLFTWEGGLLRPQYEQLFPRRVQPVGRDSFLVGLEAADWSWLRQHGWIYTVRCGDRVHTAQVPFLYSVLWAVDGFTCTGPMTHTWRAHWGGPAADMVLEFDGRAHIEAPGVSLQGQGYEQTLPFRMPADSDVMITLDAEPPLVWVRTCILEQSPGGKRVPAWDRFTPIPPPEPSAPSPGA